MTKSRNLFHGLESNQERQETDLPMKDLGLRSPSAKTGEIVHFGRMLDNPCACQGRIAG